MQMTTKSVDTFTGKIFLGLKDVDTQIISSPLFAKKICQEYVDKVGLCVTFSSTDFIYTGGTEPGVVIGLINYPRFPSSPEYIKTQAIELAAILKEAYRQKRVSIVFDDETIMLGEEE